MPSAQDKTRESWALNALRSYFWRMHGLHVDNDEALALARYETDEALSSSVNIGKTSLAWIRAHQSNTIVALRPDEV